MHSSRPIDGAYVEFLADYAGLPLSRIRAVAVAAVLEAWHPDALVLSAKMSAHEYAALLPVTVFAHGTMHQDCEGHDL